MGALIPANISKLRPSKVINFGIAPYRYNQNNTSSTGIRITLKHISCFKENEAIILCVEVFRNTNAMNERAGNMPNNTIFGGIELLSPP